MPISKFISTGELKKHLYGNDIASKAHSLFLQQVDNWDLAKKNYSELKSVKQRTFQFDGFQIKVQYNPGRIVSSSAKVDVNSINDRPCFLCIKNLPMEQRGLECNSNYIILVNPFPIFSEHFTIPMLSHKPQQIQGNIESMLAISRELGSKYSLFYNGPKCGASAPDHMHFQASPQNGMPIETETYYLNKNSYKIFDTDSAKVLTVNNYLRYLFIIETDDINSGVIEFQKLYNFIKEDSSTDEEPMMNIVASYNGKWEIYIFPRKQHRPKEYFLEGDEKILLSPASVDFGGLMITPREEDFLKISKLDIINIFEQTTISKKSFEKIVQKYTQSN